jgi:hypothetical protein
MRRKAADQFPLELCPQEIDRQSWHVFVPDLLGTVGLEGQQQSMPVPRKKMLNGLEDHEVSVAVLRPDLLFDTGVEGVAEAAGEQDADAGKLLLEGTSGAIVIDSWIGCPHDQCLFLLGQGIELIDRLCSYRRAAPQCEPSDHSRACEASRCRASRSCLSTSLPCLTDTGKLVALTAAIMPRKKRVGCNPAHYSDSP